MQPYIEPEKITSADKLVAKLRSGEYVVCERYHVRGGCSYIVHRKGDDRDFCLLHGNAFHRAKDAGKLKRGKSVYNAGGLDHVFYLLGDEAAAEVVAPVVAADATIWEKAAADATKLHRADFGYAFMRDGVRFEIRLLADDSAWGIICIDDEKNALHRHAGRTLKDVKALFGI